MGVFDYVNPTSDKFLAMDTIAGDDWNPLSPPDQPPPPDFKGAAEATAAGNLEAAQAALEANRYDIFSPLGSQTWSRDSEDAWTKNIDLSPEGQELFDKNVATQLGMANVGLMGLDQVRGIFQDPFQLDKFELDEFSPGDFEGYREDVYDAMLDRLERDIDRDWETRNAELYAGGIGRGTEAYGTEQERRDRMLNDARLQAYTQATDQALRERQQLFKERGQMTDEDMNLRARQVTEALLNRQTPLNELNAFRTGSQVQMPTFETQDYMQTPQGADYLSAAGEQAQYDLAGYNADVARQNAILGGLFGLGGAAILR